MIEDVEFLEQTFGTHNLFSLFLHLSKTLKNCTKKAEIFSLEKNGHFAILCPEHSNFDVHSILMNINNKIEDTWSIDNKTMHLSYRLCIINSEKDIEKTSHVFDIISYFASKNKFRNQKKLVTELDFNYLKNQTFLSNLLSEGFKHNRFDVFYQPIYSVKEKKLTGAEALVRLTDENNNLVSPEDFIPVAERNGSIFDIGKFVFESVCKTLSEIDTQSFNISKIDINLSVVQCMQSDLHKQLTDIRNKYNLPSSILNIEITETASAVIPEMLLRNMEQLSQEGIELSLDDYGSGNSNMTYLLTLPFKMIKIDKGIVWAAFKDKRANLALVSTIEMLKKLGLIILAEGVETKEQAEWLEKHNCDYLQGYYFSKPVPKHKFLSLMKDEQCQQIK